MADWLPPLSSGRGKKDTSRSVFDDPDTIYPPSTGEIFKTLLTEAALNALPLGALMKFGKWLAKGAARSAPVTVPAGAAAFSEDAEASFIGAKAIPKIVLEYFLRSEGRGATARALAEDTASRFGLPTYRFPWSGTRGVFAEVPDNRSRILWENFDRNPNLNYDDYLEDALEHPEVYRLVPKARELNAVIDEIPGKSVGTRGTFVRDPDFPGEGELTVGSDVSLIPSVLNHELNHGLQRLTGLPGGSKPAQVMRLLSEQRAPKLLNDLAKDVKDRLDPAHALYEAAIGEQLARESARRMHMSLEELVRYPPVFSARGWAPSVRSQGPVRQARGGLVVLKGKN